MSPKISIIDTIQNNSWRPSIPKPNADPKMEYFSAEEQYKALIVLIKNNERISSGRNTSIKPTI